MAQPPIGDYSTDRLLTPAGEEHLRARPTEGRDEISLYDIWLILTRRWRLALTLFAVISLTAMAIAMALPKRYMFTSMFEIGQVVGGRLIESPEAVRLRLEQSIIPRVRREMYGADVSGAPKISVGIIAGQGVVTISSAAPMSDQKKVQAVHAAIFDALTALHTPRFEQEVNALLLPLQNSVPALKEQEQDLQQQIARIIEPSAVNVEKISEQDFLLALRLADIRQELNQLRSRLADRKREIESIRLGSRDTHVAAVASQTDRPLGPGRGLIVALGGMLGLLVGVVTALVADLFANARQAVQSGLR